MKSGTIFDNPLMCRWVSGGCADLCREVGQVSAVIQQAAEGSCDHRGDPFPGYLGITDPAVIAAWRERYEIRMTGYAVPMPVLAIQAAFDFGGGA